MTGYKFLQADGLGVFSGFRWPLPNGAPGAWVEAEVDPCRSGVHAARVADLPYWLGPLLYEAELDGDIVEHVHKIVAARGRLVRRIDGWNDETRDAYSLMCVARAAELAASAPGKLGPWAPREEAIAAGPALMGYIASRIAEEIGGKQALDAERAHQAAWLADRLGLA
jgi:hypothetical protein